MSQITKNINKIYNFIKKYKDKIRIIYLNIEWIKIKENDILQLKKNNNKNEWKFILLLKRGEKQKKILEFKYKWINVR